MPAQAVSFLLGPANCSRRVGCELSCSLGSEYKLTIAAWPPAITTRGSNGALLLGFARSHSYATKSNKTRVLKTPGGKLAIQYTDKKASGPKCGEPSCAVRLPGVSPANSKAPYLSLLRSPTTYTGCNNAFYHLAS